MKITIYRTDWKIIKQPQFDFTRCFYALSNEIIKKYKNVEVINLVEHNNEITVQGVTSNLYDCEMLIDTGDSLRLLSFSDFAPYSIKFFSQRNNENDVILWTSANAFTHVLYDSTSKVKIPPYVGRHAFYDLDAVYEYRKGITDYKDTLTFRGNYTGIPRNVIQSLVSEKYNNHFPYPHGMSPDEYYMDMIQHKVGLSIAGASEFCFRDVEFMGSGVPMLRFEYMSNWNPPLIPNHHYIAVPRIDNSIQEEWYCGKENEVTNFRGRNEHTDRYADAYYSRFLEVKDNVEFLEFVANNARDYYNKYLHPVHRTKHLLELLEL